MFDGVKRNPSMELLNIPGTVEYHGTVEYPGNIYGSIHWQPGASVASFICVFIVPVRVFTSVSWPITVLFCQVEHLRLHMLTSLING